MDINNYSLLSLTVRKNVNLTSGALNGSNVEGYSLAYINEENLVNNDKQNVLQIVQDKCINLTDTVSISGKDVDVYGTLSDSKIKEIYEKTLKEQTPHVLTTTSTDITLSEIQNIKETLYLCNTTAPATLTLTGNVPKTLYLSNGSSSAGSKENDDNDDDSSTKSTFLKNQYASIVDTNSLFKYLNNLDSSITKSSGISRAQLVALTQNDEYEDDNYDFFGTLNRIFNVLDKDENNKLTAAEIKAFIGEELGSDVTEYLDKVNEFAEEIQNKY